MTAAAAVAKVDIVAVVARRAAPRLAIRAGLDFASLVSKGGNAGVSETFDPKQFHVAAPRGFADLKVGETFRSPSRTVTDAHFSAFQALSGDNPPIHYDVEYCRARGYPGMLAHGLQVLCFTAAGAGSFAHAIGDALIGFLELSAKFHKPVYPGDTLYPPLHIAEIVA